MPHAEIVTLTCPSCGARVNIPDGSNRFTCGYCGNEHMIQIQVQAVPAAAAAAAPIRPRVGTPSSVQVIRDSQSVRIVQRWFSAKYISMAFFAFFWDAFLIFWYGIALSAHAPFIFVIFPVIHVMVGIGVTYSTIAGFVNRTTLELDSELLTIRFDPMPWLGEKRIKTRDIKQLYCKEEARNSKNGTSISYQLHAVTQDNNLVKLLDDVESPDVAIFFEQQLETWLHITDKPVIGELQR